MNFNMFNNLKAEELKNYVRLKGLKVTGKKPVPVPELSLLLKIINVVIETAKEVEVDLKQKFDDKVKLDEMDMSDPLNLNNSLMKKKE